MTDDFETIMRRGGGTAVAEACRFFMKDDKVHTALRKVTSKLHELEVPYAVCGGMALVAHGYDRTTVDVDILVTAEGLARVHQELDGLGYVPPFKGSKHLRDVETGVRIEFLVAGQYPGDGVPKPVAFPDPEQVAVERDGVQYLSLPALLELKLASGMSNVLRAKDIGDVVELVKLLKLPPQFGEKLNEYVRGRFVELATAVAQAPPDAE